jgi:hypothetical protein
VKLPIKIKHICFAEVGLVWERKPLQLTPNVVHKQKKTSQHMTATPSFDKMTQTNYLVPELPVGVR